MKWRDDKRLKPFLMRRGTTFTPLKRGVNETPQFGGKLTIILDQTRRLIAIASRNATASLA